MQASVGLIPALSMDGVSVVFQDTNAGEREYTAVRDITLRVAPGEFLAVVGPTGCGKTTLLNLAAGLLQPSTGSVSVSGKTLRGLNADAGYLFQADALFPWRNVVENAAAGLIFRGASRAQALLDADDWVRRVGLAAFRTRYPHQLSGGMRKRVALAQVLALNPKILLMDEPFSALDVQTRSLMENELLELWQSDQKSVIFITHDLEEAIALSDRVVVLSAGPGARVIGDFGVDLPRPRDVAEIRLTPRFLSLHQNIWAVLRDEVQKGYAQALAL